MRHPNVGQDQFNNVVYFKVGIYNVDQRRINAVYFNVDVNNVRQSRHFHFRCHFQRRVLQRW